MPSLFSCRMRLLPARLRRAEAAVGSSMISARALKWTARAIATDWRCPPDSRRTGDLKFLKFGLSRPMTLRVADSIAASLREPAPLISLPRNTFAGASRLSASARSWYTISMPSALASRDCRSDRLTVHQDLAESGAGPEESA